MSLAELFYAKNPRRPWFSRIRRSSRKRPSPATPHPSGDGQAFRLELLEPRVLLSATPTEVVVPQEVTTAAVTSPANALANLDVDLNGTADALSDGIRSRPRPSSRWVLELLEPRVLLSATPTEVVTRLIWLAAYSYIMVNVPLT